MLIATWNVNSLKARIDRVLEFLELHQPDALCLQETKVAPEKFPHLELRAANIQDALVRHQFRRNGGVFIALHIGLRNGR